MDWRLNAVCRPGSGIGKDVFFSIDPTIIAEAKAICAGCPVSTECGEFALEVEDCTTRRYGIYGGLTPDDRRRIAGEIKTCVNGHDISQPHQYRIRSRGDKQCLLCVREQNRIAQQKRRAS